MVEYNELITTVEGVTNFYLKHSTCWNIENAEIAYLA